jgi:uncharacterized membrane protein (DUF2068 family)
MKAQARRLPIALRTIALFEIAKGVLAFAAAGGLLSLRHTDLHAAADAFLLRHGINPETHLRRLFIESVARATEHGTGQLASLAILYGVVRLAEGFGLWHGKAWAEWFAVLSVGIYLPLELTHFLNHPTAFSASLIFLNLGLMLYLGNLLIQQRNQRNFQRPFPAPSSSA